MKKAIALTTGLMLLSNVALARTSSLQDINYNFDQTKVNASENSFFFLRSFVDYYFGVIAKNTDSLNIAKKAGSFNGWCVGDAHPENFGILIQDDNSTIFTMNDLDDSGPCPVAYDLLRILVSSRLYMPNISSQDILNSYSDGLKGKNAKIPDAILSMDKDATKAGMQIAAKKLQGNAFKRKSTMEEVGQNLKVQLTSLLQAQYKSENLRVLDMVATSKVGGGSGGLQRYEILITNTQNQLIQLELKELVAPSIVPVATAPIPDQNSRMKKTLQITQGDNSSHYYNVFNIQGKNMLLRPKFSGNMGVTLADSSDKDNKEIINFEAYILGRIHANSVNVKDYTKALDNMDSKNWEDDIGAFTNLFNKKYNELKQ
ncbi:DUF2252 family protein [Bacteriovorax sp. PP10]|uniref:DUF2252 family protein n=1 Tax=Bacteriovorax antarcticus TaxID=3088717 RepID=A0ABU5VW72_9BACT|nr:DUF2252 family protein [Bacteriovorax sp. PP10]MEA9357211.1 DUF2252 family protein [Bacteriovorax sp. PP10]